MATKKKTPAKKSVSKKTVAKKVVTKSKKPIKYESFKISREKAPFTAFRFTEQTLYWTILLVVIFALSLWVLHIQMDLIDLINSISPVQ